MNLRPKKTGIEKDHDENRKMMALLGAGIVLAFLIMLIAWLIFGGQHGGL